MLKAGLECIPCILKGTLNIIKLSTDDENLRKKLLREVVKMFGEVDWDRRSLELYQMAQNLISQATGVSDPYFKLKREYNRKALELYPEMKRIIQGSDDPLRMAAKLAAIGNMIDFGVFTEAVLEDLIEKIKKLDFAIDELQRLRERVMKADELIYFLDNAGEIVFDKVFLETMIQVRGRPFKKLTLVCREKPILNDALAQDVEEVSLSELPNASIEVLSSDLKYVIGGEKVEVCERVRQHDLAIFKGQVNLENFLDCTGAFFLLVVKCPVISRLLKVKEGEMVLRYAP